ncbi:phosphotransferase [Actinomyces vulturis]|uniref:phosphotransferase n=1 Tax=Actinomyces vulturis TaxID=1857645 RepID=UPI000836844B|nr:phosphotransferase [Actinomyces vulturis]
MSSRPRTALSLAALACVAVPDLEPTRLALPQETTEDLRVTGVIDTRGRHWEVLEPLNDAAGATLEAESEVLRRIGEVVDGGTLSFDVPRPAGAVRLDECGHVQVRSHIPGSPLNLEALRPGPGLASGLGKVIGQWHELPTTVVTGAGMPSYDSQQVRDRWTHMLDEAEESGLVRAELMYRWRSAIAQEPLWRFKAVVVHGDLAEDNVLVAGGAVTAIRSLGAIHVGDPAEDLAWLYASAPFECLDDIEAAYEQARTEGIDLHIRERADLITEFNLVRWLIHGVRIDDQNIIDDALGMLEDLYEQVADEEPIAMPPHVALVTETSASDDAESSLLSSPLSQKSSENTDDADDSFASDYRAERMRSAHDASGDTSTVVMSVIDDVDDDDISTDPYL